MLTELYPRIHATLELEHLDGPGLLYRWPGRVTGDALILMAHWDVVPADEEGWTHEPFDAALTTEPDGTQRVWGRGAIDDKGALAGILEAVEGLLENGFQPENDVYLSFGGDEEVQGSAAERAVAVLQERGVAVDFVLDEGGAVVQGQFPGVAEPTAVIGIAEKGIATIELRAREPGGHAAHPPRSGRTATSRLARAILRVSRAVPAGLPPTVYPMFAALGSRARGLLGVAYRHPRLFRPVLVRALARGSDEANALIRTTRVVTRLRGAAADNVLPEVALAVVNMRIVVGSTIDKEVDRIRRDVGDERITVRVVRGSDPPPVAPATGRPWDRLVDRSRELASGCRRGSVRDARRDRRSALHSAHPGRLPVHPLRTVEGRTRRSARDRREHPRRRLRARHRLLPGPARDGLSHLYAPQSCTRCRIAGRASDFGQRKGC